MVKDSSVTIAVNPIKETVVFDYRKGIVNSSKKNEKSISLFLNFMVYKKGNFNCRRKGVLIVADHKLLKVAYAEGIKTLKNRFYPTKIIMEDKLRKNSKTEVVLKRIDFDITIPPDTFSERRLLKK